MNRTFRVVISGRVQRVGYRHWTHRQAEMLELSGWVRNLSDGTVEGLFSGESEAVERMIEQCFDGPRFAKVIDIQVTPAKAPETADFVQYRD